MKNSLGTKLYYSISEVAEITDLQPYTLRAWEKEFACLRPRRARGKNRAYRARDIGIIQLIKQLLYDEGYTTKGVKQKLKNEPELLQANSTIRPVQDDGGGISPPTGSASDQFIEEPVERASTDQPIVIEKVEVEEDTDDKGEKREALRAIIDEARDELREILRIL